MRPAPAALDAITRAVAALRPARQHVDIIRSALGIVAPQHAAGAGGRDTIAPDEAEFDTTDTGLGGAPDARTGAAPWRDVAAAAPRVTRLFALPAEPARERSPAWLGNVKALPLDPAVRGPWPRPKSLISPRTARGIVKALLASDLPDGSVDLDGLIDTLVQGRPLTRWPRRPVASLALGASVVVDNGPQLAPFRSDIAGLVRMLRNIVGAGRLAIHRCDGWPPQVEAAEGRDRPRDKTAFMPPPHAPVLVVSDFGLSPAPEEMLRATPQDWCDFAGALRRLGCTPVGLLPVPESEWPTDLGRSFSLVHWSTTTSARAARRAREPGARFAPAPPAANADDERHILARALAPAARIDRALLRAMRLEVLPQSSPAVESRFWWSDDVDSHGEAAITLDPARLRALRSELRRMPAAEIARRLEVVQRMHQGEAPALLMEEEIIALDLLRKPGWESEIATRLKALLRALIDGDGSDGRRIREAARWCFAALPELDLPAAAIETARDLMFAAGHRLGALPSTRGPLAHADGPPEWLMAALRPDPDRPRLPIAVSWNRAGFRVGPQDAFDGDHVIAVTDAPYPALRVTWGGRRDEPHWIALRRGATLAPPPASEAVLTAHDGASWLLEEADVADARRPLRVYVLEHPDRRSDTAAFVTALETSLRAFAGLPDSAPVVLHRLQAENWRGPLDPPVEGRGMTGTISTWRATNVALIQEACAFVVVATRAMLGGGDWSLDPLREIESRSGGGRERPVYPVDWDRSWWVEGSASPTGEASAGAAIPSERWPSEASWLRKIEWQRAAAGPPGIQRLDAAITGFAIARRIVQVHRASIEDPGALLRERLVSENLDVAVDALQALALAFHVRAFQPSVEMDPGKLDRKLWGLDLLPQAGRTSAPDETRYRDLAEADFAFVRGQAEYIYSGPVKNYLAGRDPFGPAQTAAEYAQEIKTELAEQSMPLRLVGRLESFSRFAGRAEKAELAARIGDLDRIKQGLDDGWRGGDWTSVRSKLIEHGDTFAAALHPFDTQFNSWRLGQASSLAHCRTFPELMEWYGGLLTHYLRCAARGAPDRQVPLTFEQWMKNWEKIRSLFPYNFDFVQDLGPTQRSGQPVMMIPIRHYADLVANLSDLIVLALSAKAGERHSGTAATHAS